MELELQNLLWRLRSYPKADFKFWFMPNITAVQEVQFLPKSGDDVLLVSIKPFMSEELLWLYQIKTKLMDQVN